jgi:catechol 2,3-dioxygenase-like lactoylglutathione lyase family enzyme
MFTKVGTVRVYVADQDRAKAFYTEVLGMELRNDTPLYPGATDRWLAVAPKGAATEIILFKPDDGPSAHYKPIVGKSQALTLDVTNIRQLVANLKAKGVAFAQDVDVQPWGTYATLIDLEDNEIMIVEQAGG